jgi:hypothetical protein
VTGIVCNYTNQDDVTPYQYVHANKAVLGLKHGAGSQDVQVPTRGVRADSTLCCLAPNNALTFRMAVHPYNLYVPSAVRQDWGMQWHHC